MTGSRPDGGDSTASPLSDDQSLQLAEQLLAFGDLAGASARCAEILAATSDHPGARRMAAELKFRSGAIAAYRINLDRRPDRMAECVANEALSGYREGLIRRLPAHEDAEYGAIGCGKSHIAALTDCLVRGASPYCMVLEDDFDFLRPIEELTGTLDRMEEAGLAWDVLLLSGWKLIPLAQPSSVPGLLQIFESMTTAGYIVRRRYLPKLLHCFTGAVQQLETFRSFRPRKELITLRFAIDMAWQDLQRQDRWFVANPTFGHQRAGYSDNETSYQNYDADTFYAWPGTDGEADGA